MERIISLNAVETSSQSDSVLHLYDNLGATITAQTTHTAILYRSYLIRTALKSLEPVTTNISNRFSSLQRLLEQQSSSLSCGVLLSSVAFFLMVVIWTCTGGDCGSQLPPRSSF